VPVQAGDDEVLRNMRRGYTAGEYRRLVHHIRDIVPDAAIHCDIIVGFPGETGEQFQQTYDLLEELRLDKIHLARYSAREGTVSARSMADDVSDEEKRRRFDTIEALNERISAEKMAGYVGQTVEVLVEGRRKGSWQGRDPRGKLVFFEDERALRGQLASVRIDHAGAWSLSGRPASVEQEQLDAATIPLTVL
jgi:tRNA-2-methylthio-N6-dimethylallyladenosine synthase